MGLYYDVAWHGVASREGFTDVGCRNADFGNACYNDHHYHFSHWVDDGDGMGVMWICARLTASCWHTWPLFWVAISRFFGVNLKH